MIAYVLFFQNLQGILLVYDITNAHSFDQLQYWIKTMNKVCMIFVIVSDWCCIEC